MWDDKGGSQPGGDVLFAFDAAYAADPYRVYSIVAGALPQIERQFRTVHVFCEGGYRGPRFRSGALRVVLHKPARTRSLHRRAAERLRLAEPQERWTSNITPPLEPLLYAFAQGGGFASVVAFSAGLQFPTMVFRLAHIFASGVMPLLLGVTPETRARREAVQDLAWLGAELLCDGELAAATVDAAALARWAGRMPGDAGQPWEEDIAVPFTAETALRFTHVQTFPATSLETCPAVPWTDYLCATDAVRPPARDVVLFVRPEWGYCGSATTFHNLAKHFRSKGALLIDVAIWPYRDRSELAADAALVAEEQEQIGGALYVSVRRSNAVPRLLAEAGKMFLSQPPTNIVRQKLLQYALTAMPRMLRIAMRRARISHVYLNHFFTYQYARPLIGNRRFFLDTHDIQSVNWVQGGLVNVITGKGDHFEVLLRDELRVLSKAHRLSFVNVDELAVAGRAIPAEKLAAIIALPEIAPCRENKLGEQPRLLIVASRNHPNRRGLDWFLRFVWPLVLAGWRDRQPNRLAPMLDICGGIAADFPDAQVPCCQFHGQVADLRPFYATANAVLLPVVIGSGVAIKTVEAILHHKPVVATRHALRGLPEGVANTIGYAEEAQAFATAVTRLMTSQADLDAAAVRVARAADVIRQQGYYGRLDEAMEAVRTPTVLRGAGFVGAGSAMATADSLLEQIHRVLQRYFVAGERGPEFEADPKRLVFDSDPAWLAPIFARRTMHDEDYRIFGYFRDLSSLVLDIGANYGYSVASIFAAGCRSCVLSFEPVEPLAPCLAEVERLNPGRFDYRMAALGAREGRQAFIMPVLNNRGITALTTADETPHIESLAHSICRYKMEHMGQETLHSFKLYRFAAPVQPLDAALRSGAPFGVPTSSIVAAKLDTEGTEAAILEGARDTLAQHRPLILIEGANRQPQVRQVLRGAGYAFAEREGDQLALRDEVSMRPNGFFVHSSRVAEYRACGLLCA